MNKSIVVLALAAMVFFLCIGMLSSSASAVTLNVVSGRLWGAYDVDVNGTLYDVQFVDGTCSEVFGGCDDASFFVFDSGQEALDASQELLDHVLVDAPEGTFDMIPFLTNGIGDLFTGVILTPYACDGVELFVATAINRILYHDAVDTTSFEVSIDTANVLHLVYADWTPVAVPESAAVPEPTTILLLGSGLVGIGVLRRKLKVR